ncbi:MAG: methionyl-tRNA formyltransferase [Anaerolineaceae bacterium]|jgi:methionyl-tRNA formyltransferase
MDTRVVFMGSPEFSLPILSMLAERFHVMGVVTQPNRPAGRNRQLTPPPVKTLATELGLPCIQPERLKEPQAWEQLQAWNPDLIVVVAFGQILRQNVLDLPRLGCINVHASLLPRWRGAAPIQAAILAGDRQTGVTIMKMDAGVDTGAIIIQRAIDIPPDDTAATLGKRLSALGSQLLNEALPDYLNGKAVLTPQDNQRATYAAMLKKEEGLLDFSQPAEALERKVRAFDPWPGAYFYWGEAMIKVLRAEVAEDISLPPGKHGVTYNFPSVGCAGGALVLREVQAAGKKPMNGDSFLRGVKGWLES